MARQFTFLILFCGLCAFNAFSQSKNAASRNASALCNRVSEIKQLPFKDESGVDAAYDALIGAGEIVVPCLIEKVSDVTVMPDPRCPHVTDETKVGDVAYFVLVDIIKIDFVELLPAKVREKYKTEGVYAYHEYIEGKGKRKLLQSKLREWYRQKQTQ
jgi:hypothetical protein